jgi:ribosomal subunit interface protein
MRVNIQTKGVIITAKQKSAMEKKLLRLKRYTKEWTPVICDVKLIDETGPEKGGIDQTVQINVVLPKEIIFIKETDDRIMRAFGFAHQILERKLRRYNQKFTSDRRREASRFKAVINVVGSPLRAVGSAAGAVRRFVPRRGKKKNKR